VVTDVISEPGCIYVGVPAKRLPRLGSGSERV
jgi:hypothetical protein